MGHRESILTISVDIDYLASLQASFACVSISLQTLSELDTFVFRKSYPGTLSSEDTAGGLVVIRSGFYQ